MITAWSPSKLDRYDECPLKCKLSLEDKLCPLCFKGRTKGGFGKPVVCVGGCGKTIPEPAPFERGTRIGNDLDAYVKGEAKEMTDEIRPVTKWLVNFRKAYRDKKLKLQLQIAFTKAWRTTEWFASNAWLRVSLDVLHLRTKTTWDVIDWKTGRLREDGKYADQLDIYKVAVLTAFPSPKTVTSALVFVDAGKPVPGGDLKRADLEDEHTRLIKRVAPMMSDTRFDPKPGGYCRWCDYAKGKGGPCPY